MKKMKRYLALFLAFVLMMGSLAACGMDDDYYDDDEYEYDEDYDEDNSGGKKDSKPASTGKREAVFNTGDAHEIFSDDQVRTPRVKLKGDGSDKVTIMVYMNGSNLESDDGSGTRDISEMLAAGSSDQVNLLVQTMGTKKWDKKYGIASDRSQTYRLNGKGIDLVRDDLGQLDCTDPATLQDFISWSAQNYPADRYILLFWDHGAGPVYGFGMDEFQDEDAMLTIDEMQSALKGAGVYFDFIGMDCCIMSCLELCCAFYDYCDYMILSEDFEPGIGWDYTNWLKEFYKNPSMPTLELGKMIVDDMIADNVAEDPSENAILALIDESMMKVLYTAWVDFAYKNLNTLTENNYSRKRSRSVGGRVHPVLAKKGFFSDWLSDDEEVLMADYYITDIMAVSENVDSKEGKALSSALSYTLRYVNSTDSDSGLTGLSVTLPYGDEDFYEQLKAIFTNCGIDPEYIEWLESFTTAEGYDEFYDYDDWDDEWNGWDDYDDDYDWDDWECADDDEDYDWDDWDYSNSWNFWFDDQDFEDEDAYWDYYYDFDEEDEDWYYYCD